MIDLHSHLLPGVDDGAVTEADVVTMAAVAWEAGVSAMAATPHLRDDHPDVVPGELAGRCAQLRARLGAQGIGLDVVVGGEVDVQWARRASDEELRLVSYGQQGQWLLVETPYGAVSDMFEELVFMLRARGFRTLLAHPERNPSFQRRPERLRALLERGAFFQLTAHALVGAGRRAPARRLAEALVRESAAHVLATDAHRPAGRRDVGLRAAAAAADRLAPGSGAYMTEHAPAAILAGEEPWQPPARSRPGLLRRLGAARARRA